MAMNPYAAHDDKLFKRERRPQGEATCPHCGAPMRFYEHICLWKCVGCNEVATTDSLYDDGLIVSMP